MFNFRCILIVCVLADPMRVDVHVHMGSTTTLVVLDCCCFRRIVVHSVVQMMCRMRFRWTVWMGGRWHVFLPSCDCLRFRCHGRHCQGSNLDLCFLHFFLRCCCRTLDILCILDSITPIRNVGVDSTTF